MSNELAIDSLTTIIRFNTDSEIQRGKYAEINGGTDFYVYHQSKPKKRVYSLFIF